MADDSRVLQALSSPIRHEVLAALSPGPVTVAELAGRLGRTRQALYHHLGIMLDAGLVEIAGTRGEGRREEQVYRLNRHRIRVSPRSARREGAGRALDAMLRLTARECREAVARRGAREDEVVALRGKARLNAAELKRLHVLIREIQALLAGAKTRADGPRPYALTLVLTPARTPATSRRKRKDGTP